VLLGLADLRRSRPVLDWASLWQWLAQESLECMHPGGARAVAKVRERHFRPSPMFVFSSVQRMGVIIA
jgi:hypothetical protein